MRFVGADISLNHGAFVVIDDDAQLLDHRFATTHLGIAKKGKERAYRVSKYKDEDMTAREMRRMENVIAWLAMCLTELQPDFVCLEDYAYGKHGGEKIAEVAGDLKLRMWLRGIPFRLVSPSRLKMFATGNGNADKKEVVAVVLRDLPDWLTYAAACGVSTADDLYEVGGDRNTVEDLCDATILARIAWIIEEVGSGRLLLEDLTPERRRMLLATSKTMPVNLLAMPWVRRS